jgi:RNA polymerase sigma factor (sigma-70 family)
MAATPLHSVLTHIRRAADRPAPASDARLLERFTAWGDETAFAELVRRHGPLVLGVCRRALSCHADVEDAFQATFLVLARRAAAVRRPEALPAWLHGVAWRVARKLRAAAPACGAAAPEPAAAAALDPACAAAWRELCGVLDEELHRLPPRYAEPLVLCHLEGLTRDEAAARLGYSPSTLKRRLERGRELLRLRLTRRGVTLGAALSCAALGELPAPAAVPAQLLAAASPASASARAAQLATAVLAVPAGVKLSFGVIGMLGVVLALGAGVGQRGDPPPAQPSNSPPIAASAPATDRFGDPLPPGAIARFGTIRYRPGSIEGSALSPDGRFIATDSRGAITLFDMATGRPLHLLRESGSVGIFDYNAPRLAFDPNSKLLAGAADDSTIRIWDVGTGRELHRVGTPRPRRALPNPFPVNADDYIMCGVRFTLDGNRLIGGTGKSVHFIDPETGGIARRIDADGYVIGLTRDARELVMLNEEKGRVSAVDAATGAEHRSFGEDVKVYSGTLVQDGKTLATADMALDIRVWDITTGRALRTWKGPPQRDATNNKPVTVMAVSPDGTMLFAGTWVGTVHRWELTTGRELPPLRGPIQQAVTGLFPAPGGRTVVSTVVGDGVISSWDLATGRQLPSGGGYGGSLYAARSPDGRLAALGDRAGKLDLLDAATGGRVHTLAESGPGISRLAFAPDGQTLAAARVDGTVVLWDVAARREVRTLQLVRRTGPAGVTWFQGLAFRPDGRALLTSASDDGTRLWDVAKGSEVWSQPESGEAAFAPGGQTLVIAAPGPLRLRDAVTGRAGAPFALTAPPNGRVVSSVAFAPDGHTLAAGLYGGQVAFFDPSTGAETKKRLNVCPGRPAGDTCFSPDSKWVVTRGWSDGTARVWEVATGQEVLSLKGHLGSLSQVAFGPDGRTVLTTSIDLTALLWTLRPAGVKPVKGHEEALWADLAGDAPVAYQTVWSLADAPDAAVDLLRGRFKPIAAAVDEQRFHRLVAELDGDDFRVREAASKALRDLGPAAEPQLRAALRLAKAPETQSRLQKLLDALPPESSADTLRLMRAVQALELANTAAARQLLRDWAGGLPGALLTEQARAALGRMK